MKWVRTLAREIFTEDLIKWVVDSFLLNKSPEWNELVPALLQKGGDIIIQ